MLRSFCPYCYLIFIIPLNILSHYQTPIHVTWLLGGDNGVHSGLWGQILEQMYPSLFQANGSGCPYSNPSAPSDLLLPVCIDVQKGYRLSWETFLQRNKKKAAINPQA